MGRLKKRQKKSNAAVVKAAKPFVNPLRGRGGLSPSSVVVDEAAKLALPELPPLLSVAVDAGKPLAVFPDKRTPEQEAIEACGNAAKALLAKPTIDRCLASMVAFRRAYAVAYRDLAEELETEIAAAIAAERPLPPNITDFLIHYAMYEAAKPFSEHTLMQSIVRDVLPWLAGVVDRHTEVEETEDRKEREEQESLRRARVLPIGWSHVPGGEAGLGRDRSLVLVGWRPAVLWVIDKIVNSVLAARDKQTFTVIRFSETSPRDGASSQLVRIGGNAWRHCCNSFKTLAAVMGEYVAEKLSQPPDLLVCDSLPATVRDALISIPRPPGAAAGDGERCFRKWCNGVGAGFVGGIGCDDKEVVDITQPAYEQLRTFTHLRTVRVLEEHKTLDAGKYRIVVGDFAEVFDVDKAILDSYDYGTILVPGGVTT